MAKEEILSLENLLTQTCQIQKIATSAAATGGVINTYTDRIGSVACLFNQRKVSNISEEREFGKRTNRDEDRLYLQAQGSALSIIPSDRAVIGSRTFEVTTQPYNAGNRNVLMHIGIEEIQI